MTFARMFESRRDIAKPSLAVFSPSEMPFSANSSGVVLLSWKNFAASTAVPRPSAMFCKAPMARAFLALLATMWRTVTDFTPSRFASS